MFDIWWIVKWYVKIDKVGFRAKAMVTTQKLVFVGYGGQRPGFKFSRWSFTHIYI